MRFGEYRCGLALIKKKKSCGLVGTFVFLSFFFSFCFLLYTPCILGVAPVHSFF